MLRLADQPFQGSVVTIVTPEIQTMQKLFARLAL